MINQRRPRQPTDPAARGGRVRPNGTVVAPQAVEPPTGLAGDGVSAAVSTARMSVTRTKCHRAVAAPRRRGGHRAHEPSRTSRSRPGRPAFRPRYTQVNTPPILDEAAYIVDDASDSSLSAKSPMKTVASVRSLESFNWSSSRLGGRRHPPPRRENHPRQCEGYR
jgi:hypothetical protein